MRIEDPVLKQDEELTRGVGLWGPDRPGLSRNVANVRPEGRADFFEWHNREHIPERVGIEGFLRGRRYVATAGAPAFFTLYNTRDAAVLSGAANDLEAGERLLQFLDRAQIILSKRIRCRALFI